MYPPNSNVEAPTCSLAVFSEEMKIGPDLIGSVSFEKQTSELTFSVHAQRKGRRLSLLDETIQLFSFKHALSFKKKKELRDLRATAPTTSSRSWGQGWVLHFK